MNTGCVSKLEVGQSSILRHKFNRTIMNTAYSTIRLAPINTAEHFHLASHLGFNALKGDVRITSDGGLVMCHDAAFTFDENGRIDRFDKTNCTKIIDMTYEQVMALEYAADFDVMGHYARVCSFDTFVRICKEQGMICYVTLRNDRIEDVVRSVIKTLEKYYMIEHCMINSFTLETLQEVRKYNHTIPLSNVIPARIKLERKVVENMIPLGNAAVTAFFYGRENKPELWEASKEALELAREHDIQIHMAQVGSFAVYSDMIQKGVQGFHITRAYLPYNRSDIQFAVRLKAGEAVFEDLLLSDRLQADVVNNGGTVRISNIRNNGSGYGYDDGLPALWMNRLPYRLDVTCAENTNPVLRWDGAAFVLETNAIEGLYFIHISI